MAKKRKNDIKGETVKVISLTTIVYVFSVEGSKSSPTKKSRAYPRKMLIDVNVSALIYLYMGIVMSGDGDGHQ